VSICGSAQKAFTRMVTWFRLHLRLPHEEAVKLGSDSPGRRLESKCTTHFLQLMVSRSQNYSESGLGFRRSGSAASTSGSPVGEAPISGRGLLPASA
jgi:hypothetical protein